MKANFVGSIVIAFGLGGVVGYSIHGNMMRQSATIEAGDELQTIASDQVTTLSFANDQFAFTAQRSKLDGNFNVLVTFSDGRPARSCTMSSDLGSRLSEFVRITAKKGLSVDEREHFFPAHVGNFSLQTFGSEPVPIMSIYADADRRRTAVISSEYLAEVETPLSAFEKLEMGCGAGSGKSR